MTSLQSLLARFKQSAKSSRRRSRPRNTATRHAAAENLEQRLLLVNPVALSSKPDAPVTVYLDFDGDTEGTVAWTQIRQDGQSGSINTPAFSFDANDAFNQAEIDSITEIFHRVAEDFRPFDVNVTTVNPVNLGPGRELEVVVGGDGSWRLGGERYAALGGSYSDPNISQKAFVFQARHNGLGGTFEQNVAASISTATAVSMGLRDRSLQGNSLIAPILGDQIVGSDTNLANLNSERDIWFDAAVPSGGIQDDLALLDAAENVDYRADDVGDTAATSTGVDTVVGTETVVGVIEQNDDVDVFAIATAATTATFTVSTLDVRNQFPGSRKTPGSNLDPTLTIRDANGTVIASADDPGLNSSLSASLTSGLYFIEISNGGAYGNLGEYTLTIDGIDQLPSYANPVSLNSHPGAAVDLYLGFAGGQIRQGSDLLAARTDGALGTKNLTPYDTDGDATSFTPQEINEISEIWARVAEDFRPFNVNVTTIDPGTLVDEQSAEVLIGGSEFVATPSLVSYTALSNAFTDSTLENTGVVFSADMPTPLTQYSLQQEIATFASATFGTMFGLERRVAFTGLTQHFTGDAETAPIMGAPTNALRDTWTTGPTPTTTQDPLALITDDLTNNIDYRLDDHSDLLSGATVIPIGVGNERLSGIIEKNGDADVFRFDTLATTATINVTGLNLTSDFVGVTNPGSNLDPVLQLLDANGAVIASDDVPFNLTNGNRALTASLSEPIDAGTYYIRVTTDGDYGNLGEYTVTLQGVDVVPVSVTIDPDTFAESDGLQAGVGMVERPAGQVGTSDLVIDLFSQDISEVTVQPQVTIPAGAINASFDITLVDDTLLDGDQRVEIVAQVGGVDNGGTFVTVTDVETIELSITPDPIQENGGSASLTVRRSNTDVDAPNHWVVSNNNLLEYSPAGALVRTVPIEWFDGDPRPLGQDAHDIVMMENGRIAVFNGTETAGLSVYSPEIDVWEHFGPIDGLSVNGSDSASGGLSTTGDYVFLTDEETFVGDLHGMIRVNVRNGEIDRFGEGTLGARLFAMATSSTSTIYEFNPTDGSLVNTLTLPTVPGSISRFAAEAIAFDGTDLWVLSPHFAASSFHQLIRVNANTGDLLEVHPMGIFPNDIFLDGLAELDGTLYLTSTIGVGGAFGAQIQAYDPARRLPVAGTLSVEAVNGISVQDIIGSLPQSNRLLAVDPFADVIYQIDPSSGVNLSSFAAAPGRPFGFGEVGITSVGDIIFQNVNYDELIYVEADRLFQSTTQIDVYTTTGSRIDTDPSTPVIDPLTTEVRFTGDLAGKDVPGVETSDLRFRDVTTSLDGRLFGLLESGDEISIHDPESLVRLGGIQLDQPVNTIAVGDNSGIYGGNNSGDVIRFNFSGVTEASSSTNLVVINDIEVNVGREVILSDAAGNVMITNQDDIESGAVATTPPLENAGGTAFATFGRHKSRTTGDVVVTLASSDLTELQVPPTVTIPEGEQEITIDVSVIDDNERDGDQTVSLLASSMEHLPGSLDVVVQDHEEVRVDVIPASIPENAGTVADVVTISRTDTDGPYTAVSSHVDSVQGPINILDDNVINSRLTVPEQVSRITDVNVKLSIDHEAIPDLDVYLISPSGTRVELFTDLSTNETQMVETVFDDQAATSIIDGNAPYTGRFLPEQLLTVLDGENPSGVWSLEVIDDNETDIGQLLYWELQLSTIGLAPLDVTLQSSDLTEASVETSVTIPINQAQVVLPLTAIDDNLLDGSQPVQIDVTSAAVTDSFGDFQLVGDVVDITDAEEIIITVDQSSVSEAANNPAIVGTLTRSDVATTTDLIVSLSSSDLSELSVPATVTIPANQTSVNFDISVVDDQLFDGDQIVTITADATGFLTSFSEPITVLDREPRLTMSTVAQTVAEDSGSFTVTLARVDADDVGVPQDVNLSVSDSSELAVPASVTIPAGEFSTSFTVTVLDDTLLDGSQTVTILATDANVNKVVNDASLEITVEDAEYVSLAVTSGSSVFSEIDGAGVAEVTVTLTSADHVLPVFVSLTNSDVTEVSVPQTVIIPAGAASATFLVNAVDDVLIDSNQTVQLTASLENFISGSLELTVTDYEPPILTGPIANTEDPTPSITWAPLTGAVRYDLWVNDVSRGITQLFRHENLSGGTSIIAEDFESSSFDPAIWNTVDQVVIDDLAANDPSGTVSAHFDGGPSGVDLLETATFDLAGRAGVQLTYSFQKSTRQISTPADPNATDPAQNDVVSGQDLIFSYRNADGFWVQLDRQFSSTTDFSHFETVRLDLPEAALHSEFALRVESLGPVEPEDNAQQVVRTDWFLDYIELTEHQSFTPLQELGVGRYRAWVRGFDSLNRATAWSRGMDFRVVTRPEFVTPVNQSFVSTTNFPEISWTSVVDTTYYDLWINNITTGESQVVRETELPTTSYASELAGLSGGAYRAWTRATVVDVPRTEALRADALVTDPNLTATELSDIESLVYGRWSTPVNFTVLSTPTITTPSGATFIRRPEISWTAVEGASNYYVWLARRTPGEAPQVVLRDRFVTDTTRVPDADLEDGTYVVWVQAISADGTPSRWSAAQTFTVNGNVTILTPKNNDVVPATPTFQWTAITGTERYEVWVNRVDVPTHQSVYSDDVRGTSFTVREPLVSGGTYRLWVRAVSEMGEFSFWSFPITFSVADNESTSDLSTTLVNFDVSPALSDDISKTHAVSVNIDERPHQQDSIVRVVDEGNAPAVEAPVSGAVPEIREDESEIDSVMQELAVTGWAFDAVSEPDDNSAASIAGLGLGLLASASVVRGGRDKRQQR